MRALQSALRHQAEWKCIEVYSVNSEELEMYFDTVECVKSDYGKSLLFIDKLTGERQFVILNPKSSAVIGKKYPLTSVRFQVLAKIGRDNIDRCFLDGDEI